MNEFRDIAQRQINAETGFIASIVELAGCTTEQAEKVLRVYRKAKVVKTIVSLGRIEVKHGIFLEKDVLWNTINS